MQIDLTYVTRVKLYNADAIAKFLILEVISIYKLVKKEMLPCIILRENSWNQIWNFWMRTKFQSQFDRFMMVSAFKAFQIVDKGQYA